jgi:cell division protein FtsI/penicillin-binding protein 2
MFKSLILFHRRLLVLISVVVAVLIVLLIQVGKLTILQGEERFDKAEGRLHSTTYLPTWRGKIVDRKNRVVAHDVASYDIAVDWDLITGDRAIRLARKDAKASVGSDTWKSMSPENRELIVEKMLPNREAELAHFWKIVAVEGGISPEKIAKRIAFVKKEVEKTANVVWERQEEEHKKRYGENVPFVARPIKEQSEPHVVLPRVSDEIAMQFSLLGDVLDGAIKVVHSRDRSYPLREQTVFLDGSTVPSPMAFYDSLEVSLDHVAELIVGDVRGEVWAEDVKRKPFRTDSGVDLSGYRAGDEVGKRGIESSMELKLRGIRGRVVKHRNGEELERSMPVGGEDVSVTLDMKLQARIEAVMSYEFGLMQVQPWHGNTVLPEGTPLRGAVVVLDALSSEVLAMVSTPALQDEHDVEGYPWLNRAAQGYYPPGSIVKPLVLAGAMTDGKLQQGEEIECVGHFFKHVKDAARCWIYRQKYNNRTHGKLQPVEAIARSCNIFFYELGSRLGFDRLLEWLQKFGMSKPLSAALTNPEARGTEGHFPSNEDIQSLQDKGALAFETVSVSIGQGALTWSPLHAAAAYATLARGGVWKTPTLITSQEQKEIDLHLDQTAVKLALEGLRDSISKKYGTGSRLRFGEGNEELTFNIDGVRLWGKTGTAEAPPYRLSKESPLISGLDHSWFLVMASPMTSDRPTVVVAVLVEHGGSGGRVAGPIANQVLLALQSEGYLEPSK